MTAIDIPAAAVPGVVFRLPGQVFIAMLAIAALHVAVSEQSKCLFYRHLDATARRDR